MAEISKITLPSGNTYDIKDATAREMISGGVSFIVAWNGTSTPTVSAIPAGVVVTYNGTNYTGTLAPASAQSGAFYLVKSSTAVETLDVYDEYVVAEIGGTKTWEKLGDTQVDLSNMVTGVTLNKQTDVVLGEATTFTLNVPSINVTTSNARITGEVEGQNIIADSTAKAITDLDPTTDTFVKGLSVTSTNKLVTTTVPNVTGNTNVTIPNVTSAGSASTWSFAMGTGTNAETLIISGSNSTAPTLGTSLSASKVTLGTAKTVATGSVASNGTGSAVVTAVSASSTGSALTGITSSTSDVMTAGHINTQQVMFTSTVGSVATENSYVDVATGISSASASGGSVTAGTNDKVTALTNSTSITVSKDA